MPDLETGTYVQSNEIKVTYWPSPDKNGDGEEAWEDRKDADGNPLGRFRVKDDQGNEVFHYLPPEGFENKPGYDHTDNYVRVDNRGRVLRDANGQAMSVREGHALVEYPDGTSQVLTDEYARYRFGQAHKKVSTETPNDPEE